MMMMSNKIWVLRKNQMKMPTDRSLIGQKLDFRVSHDQFEMLISLRSGGLPSAPKSKKWIDKIRISFTIGVHSSNYNYNVYGLDWKTQEQLIISLLRVEKTLYRMRKTRQEILFDKQGYIDCEDHHRAQ
ncbi:uncharacterized protein OCT59_020339 [Rhizophagus irregularis]|uniref:uncharacterized protein n=1 Tax=Rhizophagus irregularis TaxID=588596 RepID=UPI0019F7D8C7|nr:hypothetical protein OCT59_020339 [Rhizophagus irregularis]GET59927.1 hypothetical protein GLOIN_2v1764697 [Rhizophagus irregularis DAOM 181602=DAOM 197198]